MAESLVHSEATQSNSAVIALNIKSKGTQVSESSIMSRGKWIVIGSPETVTGPQDDSWTRLHEQSCPGNGNDQESHIPAPCNSEGLIVIFTTTTSTVMLGSYILFPRHRNCSQEAGLCLSNDLEN
jgi:hypothetical protein